MFCCARSSHITLYAEAGIDDGSCTSPEDLGFCDCAGNILDECGACGGSGIPDGECDCDGNVLDECGICNGNGCHQQNCEEFPLADYDCSGVSLALLFGGIVPEAYNLHSIYPNPFNPITNITYGLPEYTDVHIVIYDISGKQIETLINESQSPGYHRVDWNADQHPSGVYFIKMVAGEYISTQKLMLVK